MDDLDLSKKSDRLIALKRIAAAQAKDPECQRNLKALFDSPPDDALATLIRAAERLADSVEHWVPALYRDMGLQQRIEDLRNAITNAKD